MNNNTQDITGRYRHYKGTVYEVIGTARHTETEETLVVYKSLHKSKELWVRPFTMFFETVLVDGKNILRFTKLENRK